MAIIRPEQLSSGSYKITGSFTGSFTGDGSQLTGIVSSKWSGSNPITRQSDVEITGSLRVTGGVTSSLFGTSSWALNAISSSYATTASYALTALSSSFATTASYTFNAITASYALHSLSSSYSETASYVNPLYQNVLISGSLKLDPTQDPDPSGLDLDSTVFFQSSSNTPLGYDLYIRQDGNLVKWKWLEGLLNTGILYGGALTYSGTNFYISSGSGIIVSHNATTGSEVGPIIKYVTWPQITQSINTGTQNTYVYIDQNGQAQQQTSFFTPQQYHEYLPIGRVSHYGTSSAVVTGVGNNLTTAFDVNEQQNEFIRAFGPLKLSGLSISGQSGSLRINLSSGVAYNLGGYYQNQPDLPSIYTSNAYPTSSIIRIYRSGSVGNYNFDNNNGSYYTTIDPTKWDDGSGTLQNVGGEFTIQRVFVNPVSGRSHIYYGQAKYNQLSTALQSLTTDPFVESEVTLHAYVLAAYIVVKGNASSLTDTSTTSIVQGGLFRNTVGGSAGGTIVTNLDDLGDVSIVSPTNREALVYNAGIWENGTPLSSSYALSSSFATNALSSSFALTASYLSNYIPPFPFTGSAIITGSLQITGSLAVSGVGEIKKIKDNYNSTGSSGQLFTADGSNTKWISLKDTIQLQINSEGPTVVSGSKGFRYTDDELFIQKVTIKSTYTGSIEFILKDGTTTYGSSSITNNVLFTDTTLSNWTRTIPSASLLEFVVGPAGGFSSGSASTFLFLINTIRKPV